jgi:sarcosine oxidase subunit beta
VVIGAGVIGSSVAWALARSGRSVLVVDKGPGPGAGSTSASSAIVRFHYSTWAGVATAWEAKHAWEDWAGHLGAVDPAGLAKYHRTGSVMLDIPTLNTKRIQDLFDQIGIPWEPVTADDLRQRFQLDAGCYYPPRTLDDETFWSDADSEVQGFYTPEGGFVDDPQLAAHNLFHAAQCAGATGLFRREVSTIDRVGDRVAGVTLDDGTPIDAPVVVNVAGPHSGHINELAGVQHDFLVRTRPLRQEVHHVPAPERFRVDGTSPQVTDGDLGTYFRPHLGGSVLVGGLEPECDPLVWLDDADRYDGNPTTPVWEAQTTRLARRVPDVRVPARPKGVVGVYDVSDDWIPLYDRTSLDGYYVAIGTSGNQFKNAPVVGSLMTELIDRCEAGHDHDNDPVTWTGPRTGLTVDLSHYSRRREIHADSSFSVLG